MALVNETISYALISRGSSNAVNANIYVLLEGILYVGQFRTWGAFQKGKWQFRLLIGTLLLVWGIDNFILNHITTFNSLYRIYYSFCLVFLSIDEINRFLARMERALLKNPIFLICIGLLVFYTYKATMEVFYLLKLPFSFTFYDSVNLILTVVNLFVNLIFALAIIWIPTKHRYTLPS